MVWNNQNFLWPSPWREYTVHFIHSWIWNYFSIKFHIPFLLFKRNIFHYSMTSFSFSSFFFNRDIVLTPSNFWWEFSSRFAFSSGQNEPIRRLRWGVMSELNHEKTQLRTQGHKINQRECFVAAFTSTLNWIPKIQTCSPPPKTIPIQQSCCVIHEIRVDLQSKTEWISLGSKYLNIDILSTECILFLTMTWESHCNILAFENN